MEKNAYFVVENKDDGTFLKIIPEEGGGKPIAINDIMYYLDAKQIQYDIKQLNNYLSMGKYDRSFRLNNKKGYPHNEHLKLDIDKYGLKVVGRFFAPSNDGSVMTLDDIIHELKRNNIVNGYILKNIKIFEKARLYCTDILLAKAVKPVHGHDAEIEYYFETEAVAKPKLNDDGTVDFHQLGNISHVNIGDKLAHLTPADPGTPGKDIFGNAIPAKTVVRKVLKHGRNISLSDDKLDMYSDVSGHATLVDDTVYVSDVYEVPNNVDASTGDIEYNGNVLVKGNVNTGYTVKAAGDVIVEGVVEGANIHAGGDITLRLGVQGMFRACLSAGGNIVSRFLENCEIVKAGGSITTDAIMHSDVRAKDAVIVAGKRGLITGGQVVAGTHISAKTLGSGMDTQTLLEVGIDPDIMDRYHYLDSEKTSRTDENEELKKSFETFQKQVKSGMKVDKDRLKKMQDAKEKFNENESFILEADVEIKNIMTELENAKSGYVEVTGTVHTGVTVTIAKAKFRVTDELSYTKFVKDGADIRKLSL